MSYVVLCLVVFLGSFLGSIVGHYLCSWIENYRLEKAFEPLYKNYARK